jgi:hypothetical protein
MALREKREGDGTAGKEKGDGTAGKERRMTKR